MGRATDLSERFAQRSLTRAERAARRRRAEMSGPNVEITSRRQLAVRDRPQQAPRILTELPDLTFD